ncbi:hypothetical protein BDW72DRAFT_201096 [Aspergillus terricola var. indicus]
MATEPLYPEYLPVRPEGFTPTLDSPPFVAEEPGLRADPELPELLSSKTISKNVTPRVGTEIWGLQLSQLTPAGLDQVALLAAQRGVLVFRDQDFADIGPERQLAIARHFNPLHKHPTMGYPKGTGPEFQVVYADEKAISATLLGSRTTYDLWHIDQTFTPNTPGVTFSWVLEVPRIRWGRYSLHFVDSSVQCPLTGISRRPPPSEAFTHQCQASSQGGCQDRAPAGDINPVTKEPVLFVNPTIARQVVGFKPSESDFLLGFLHDHIRSLDFSCRISWEKGTVVVWDQRTVAHSAIPDFKEGERRHMVRIIPYGSQPQPL